MVYCPLFTEPIDSAAAARISKGPFNLYDNQSFALKNAIFSSQASDLGLWSEFLLLQKMFFA